MMFMSWLLLQHERPDLVGDLAMDVRRDPPEGRSIGALRRHMRSRGACPEAMEALRIAVDEWRTVASGHRRRVGVELSPSVV